MIYFNDLKFLKLKKSFGKYINSIPLPCKYKHKLDPVIDKIQNLDVNKPKPEEGFIKFKLSHVNDTIRIYINILIYQGIHLKLIQVY